MSNSDIIIGEVVGTALLILLGGGVCAAVTFKHSKAHGAGWVAVTFGWGMAVLTAAYTVAGVSGAHINPAVTIGLAVEGGTPWSDVPLYIGSQITGGALGAALVWVAYLGQFRAHLTDPEIVGPKAAVGGPGAQDTAVADRAAQPTAEPGPVLGIFSTGPEIRNTVQNLLTEVVATFVLVLAILTQGLNQDGNGLGAIGVLVVALVVVGIGLSLGGPTGYAINPARDLGPRITHALLPLPNKGGSDWSYAWIPVMGPLLGGALAGVIYNLAFA